MKEETHLAVFIDFENIALGLHYQKRREAFDINKVLARLLEKGRIILKRAYADWGRYENHKKHLHEAGFELIDIPKRRDSGKNSADIRLSVDAIDLAHSNPYLDVIVIVSGDSDFTPLVSKLREKAKRVIGIGMKGSTSDLLVENCDEFIFYEDLERPAKPARIPNGLPKEKREAIEFLIDTISAMVREDVPVLHSSRIKQTMRRKRPQFDETHHGFRSFTDLLEYARKLRLLELSTDPRSGTYVVTRLLGEA